MKIEISKNIKDLARKEADGKLTGDDADVITDWYNEKPGEEKQRWEAYKKELEYQQEQKEWKELLDYRIRSTNLNNIEHRYNNRL